MRNSFPVTAYCSMSSAVVVTQTCNALLQQTVAPLACGRSVATVCCPKYTSTVTLFVFEFSYEDPQIWVTHTDLSIPPVVVTYINRHKNMPHSI